MTSIYRPGITVEDARAELDAVEVHMLHSDDPLEVLDVLDATDAYMKALSRHKATRL